MQKQVQPRDSETRGSRAKQVEKGVGHKRVEQKLEKEARAMAAVDEKKKTMYAEPEYWIKETTE